MESVAQIEEETDGYFFTRKCEGTDFSVPTDDSQTNLTSTTTQCSCQRGAPRKVAKLHMRFFSVQVYPKSESNAFNSRIAAD